jgi:hypothetical protein
MLAGDYLQAGEVGSPKRLIPLIPIQPVFYLKLYAKGQAG